MRRFFAVIVVALLGAPLAAQPAAIASYPAILINYGVSCQFEPLSYLKGNDTIDGEIVVTRPRGPGYDVVTRNVPMRTGLVFGFTYRLDLDASSRAVEIRLSHPPMGDQGRTLQTWQSFALGGGHHIAEGYLLEDDFELVQGEWVFRVYDGANKLLDVPFVLQPDGSVPEVQRRCDGWSGS